MKRWRETACSDGYYGATADMEEDPDGDWVSFEDHAARVEELQARISAAQLAAERYHGSQCPECAGLVAAVLEALKPVRESQHSPSTDTSPHPPETPPR